ncbi:tetraacyldisaccharide 4'-kinase [Porphyromonas levii]|uniref:tetraacyldisaccharide 4'-kinase n=1 Tax=Porphyromonas levii TaxID=28114 RepID=UPI001B8C860C|nr:tetraacyldisaccharide 4'-kinase [Porphyromonas levii]MBR8732040.1 Tetraacyldisaccharide 4'-kinase [Porphyromonas levii]MBR8770230.1 Tetraacyldisaccharide 4'-kinase [Porphyromonas levii]MBR8785337.1 Tetraacyldisaccharide 4'-kinase [Porphyromonas levii]MBR8806716.1 Tetraacyldisaccharide 4'-kinase [Porphyromonas levii]
MDKSRNILLWIPTALYGMAVGVRNFAFDKGILKSWSSEIPTICIGNLSVGGTGKTPHIELLISLLISDYKVAVLTRGYGRKTKKPIIATIEDDANRIGDEPYQIKRKYPKVMVYVDGDRRRALKKMEAMPPEERPDVVLMDDGFQHRSVTPSYSILLTPYHKPYYKDYLMPYGRLRESRKEAVRAETIILTGTPRTVNINEKRLKIENLQALAYQDVLSSYIKYDSPRCLFEREERSTHEQLRQDSDIQVVSGIADPSAFQRACKASFPKVVDYITYPDHHDFTKEELDIMVNDLESDPSLFILTTEKDGMRFLAHKTWIPESVRGRIWILPISIDMDVDDKINLLRKAKRAIKFNGLPL